MPSFALPLLLVVLVILALIGIVPIVWREVRKGNHVR